MAEAKREKRLRQKRERDREYQQLPNVKTKRTAYWQYRKHVHWARLKLPELRCRARALGVPFDLVATDLVLPDTCPVFGTPIVVGGPRNDAPSVDRIFPSLGYVKGNIVIVSNRANTLKNNMSIAEMKRLYEFYSTYEVLT